MLAIVAWFDFVNQRGMFIDATRRAHGFNSRHMSALMAEHFNILDSRAESLSGHFLDAEGFEQVSQNSGQMEFFLDRVDLPLREQVYDPKNAFTHEADHLWSVFQQNEFQRSLRKRA